jgi:phosphatidylserine decarboxylase
MRWPFTPYGTGTLLLFSAILLGLGAGLAALAGGWWWLVPLPLWVFVLSFFRDPQRSAPGGELDLVSPADGLLADIVQVTDPVLGVPCTRIGIFLSVFNVHVNRSPCTAEVLAVHRRDGACLDARDPRATAENQAATLVLARPDGRRLAVRQITGKIARRIICPASPGQRLLRGERYGMIRFGSRTELVVPVAALEALTARVGDQVTGGQTLLARMRPASAPAGSPASPPAHAAAG